ncbi:MAG: endonuclease MutS2 [Candidatus Eremiobacteraeota bacterium]|nr:endonuclease MutS2 [Candidatus Eremiobacteraeota bacterium]
MQLADERTLETFDFASIRSRVIALAQTERGVERAQALAPLVDLTAVRLAQRATADVRELVVASDMFVGRAVETEPLMGAAVRGQTLSSNELRALGDSLASAAAAYNKTRETQSQTIRSLTAAYRPLKDLITALTDAIDERGTVMDRASPALGRIRRNLVTSQNDARDRVTAMLRSSKYANAIQDAVVTIREGRFVVPIKAEFSGEFPGIVHDTSSSGQTLFVEPLAALETNNRLRTLRLEEEREVARILLDLSSRAAQQAPQIELNMEMLATLDVLVAKARLSIAMAAVEPEISGDSEIDIRQGRHPLLSDRAVPQSISLGGDSRLVVISGPNMGGKTVALKMVGLFVAMTYCGLQVPAQSGTRIGCFERIFTDIGDEQSIADNASTFSAHLARMREIIIQADARSLILVDEIGGGTEPSAGAALAIAMLERILTLRACGIVTTHATELKLFAHGTPGVVNASVRFDPSSFVPTYHLDVGTPGQSLAFPLARAMGIPRDVIDRAEARLENRERDYERALADLSTIQSRLASDRNLVLKEQTHIAWLQENLRKRTDALETQRRTFARTADERMRQALADFTIELQRRAQTNATRPKVTSAQSDLLSRVVDEMHRDLGIRPERSDETPNGKLEPGDRVRVLSYGQEGDVIADNGDFVLVSIGAMRTSVSKSDVRRTAAPKKTKRGATDSGAAKLGAAMTTVTELDVRGKRFIEAEPLVDQWIDEAVLAGNSPLRLIHGKGTGLLGRGLQEFLKDHGAVKNVRFGDESEGGSGVTVFELR